VATRIDEDSGDRRGFVCAESFVVMHLQREYTRMGDAVYNRWWLLVRAREASRRAGARPSK